MKILSKANWLKLAAAFLTPFDERTERQRNLTRNGICRSVSVLRELDCSQNQFLYDEICKFNGDETGNLDFLPTRNDCNFHPNNDVIRGTFCLFMAEAQFDIESED